MNSYQKALEWLYGTQDRGVKLGLENVRRLLARFDNPHRRLRCAHVTGTNGKGSVCAMMASICRAQGLRTGLFTSPHLVRFNERINIDGHAITDDFVVEGLEQIRGAIEPETHPTFFEITTVLAFNFFVREGCDLVVLETGLGGRLDATNVVSPLVTVLTSIDLDHQKLLGNTHAEIAREKAGIIKPGIPVVSAPQCPEVESIIREVALRHSAPVRFIRKPVEELTIALAGSHQRLNAAIAIGALESAQVVLSDGAVRQGLATVHWPGRFQCIDANLVLDGAHNPSAIAQLIQTWEEHFGPVKPAILFGALRDKAIKEMLLLLKPLAAELAAVPVNSRRAASPQEIQALAGPDVDLRSFSSVPAALAELRSRHEMILATGSLFLVGELLAIFEPASGNYQPSLQ